MNVNRKTDYRQRIGQEMGVGDREGRQGREGG